jgi:hypothetical protein
VDAGLDGGAGHVEPERRQGVVAEEPTGVRLAAGPLAQRQLQLGERARRSGQVDREDRRGHRRVHPQQPGQAQRDQRAGHHEDDGQRVDHRDQVRPQHAPSLARRKGAGDPPAGG